MKKMMSVALIALTAVATISTPAQAKNEPWKSAQPKVMIQQHVQVAAEARKVHSQVGAKNWGYDPLEAQWDYQGDRLPNMPISNMTTAALSSLLIGRYYIFDNGKKSENFNAVYFGANGQSYYCELGPGGKYVENEFKRTILATPFGLSGIAHLKNGEFSKNARGFPVVGDPRTGELSVFRVKHGRWISQPGWIQKEYPAVFAEHCPKMPRLNNVNQAQTGKTIQELKQNAKPVRGYPVAFPNFTQNPLTAGMYYHLYPPAQ